MFTLASKMFIITLDAIIGGFMESRDESLFGSVTTPVVITTMSWLEVRWSRILIWLVMKIDKNFCAYYISFEKELQHHPRSKHDAVKRQLLDDYTKHQYRD